MNRTKRFISIIISMFILVSLFTGCVKGIPESEQEAHSSTDKPTKATSNDVPDKEEPEFKFPIVETPITLKIFCTWWGESTAFDNMTTWVEYEKLSNIKIDWILVDQAVLGERKALALSTGDLPDVFLKTWFTEYEQTKYGGEGSIIPLNDLIEKHAPNYKKVLDDQINYPGVKQTLTMIDGNIYSFGYIMDKDFYAVKINPQMYINKRWLDVVGKDMPTTTEEFYDVLKTFKTRDPNGNGEPDEIPWYVHGPHQAVCIMSGAWGLQNRGIWKSIDYDENAKKLRFWPADPNFKEILQYLNRLFKEELIVEELFEPSIENMKELASGLDSIGAFALSGSSYVGPERVDDFVGLDCALKGPYGDQLWACTSPLVMDVGSCVITNKNKYPIETVKWLDYFYTDDGMKLYFLGKEGLTYRINPDGSIEFTELLTNDPEGRIWSEVQHEHVPFAGGCNPVLLSDKYFKGDEAQPIPMKAAANLAPYALKEVWPNFKFTKEETERLEAFAEFDAVIWDAMVEFITGRLPFTEWDNYIARLNKIGIEEFLEIQQIGYERYLKD